MGDVHIVRDLDELESLASAWEGLHASLPSPMQQYAWTRAAAEAFERVVEPRVVVVDGPHTRAIAALARPRRAAPRLETLGRQLWEPVDFLYEDEGALAELIEGLARLGLPLALSRLPLESPAHSILREAFRGSVLREHARVGAPLIRLDESWREPEARFDAGRRSDFRRARRRAERGGEVTTEIVSPSPDRLAALLDEAVAVEDRSWKGARGTSLARDPLRLGFFRLYGKLAAAEGTLRLAFLRVGGRAVAMQVAVEHGGGFWLLKIGYDRSLARASPGQLLMLETVRFAAQRGLDTFEFLGGDEPWTRVWTQEVRPCASVRVYPRRAASLAAAAEDALRLGTTAIRARVRRG